ncbi:carbohydrate-binding protein [Nitrospira sp. T9]|uniref:carbohydrate-binding protein n=1 Tax=unclassified Nitrospira TaxID=2652172 RepID=UPI003F991678
MRKRVIGQVQDGSEPPGDWLNVEELAEVEITSEDAAYPIEAALVPGGTSGWRAAGPGKQTIRLLFATPQPLRRIWLNFLETRIGRTQEYVLRWSSDGGQSFREIVRQQWNFSPDGATSQTEDHHVELPAVTVLELSIIPDTSGSPALASLAQLRLA